MPELEVWEKASTIAAAFGDDELEHFAERLFDILQETANPRDWPRIAAAVDVIAAASKH